MAQSSPTFRQKLFLVIGMPAIILAVLELTCRVFDTPTLLSHQRKPQELEMPTWMLREENVARRATRARVDPAALEWLTLFEEAPGFRVRLKPSTERWVSNTFSLIPFDRQNKYLIRSNSLGFRGPEITSQKQANTFRILIFGDSSSFGWGVNQDETFAALLPQYLSASGRPIEVGNFSIPGDSSEYGRLVAEQYMPDYHPDLVIIGFGANDAKRVLHPHKKEVDQFRNTRTTAASFFRMLAEYSAIFRTMESMAERLQATQASKPVAAQTIAVPTKRFRENVRAIAAQGIQAGARGVVVLSLCTPGNYAKAAKKLAKGHGYSFLNGQAMLLKRIADVQSRPESFSPRQTALITDMRQHYPEELSQHNRFLVTSDGCHPNALGHDIVAESLASEIEPLVQR